MCVWDGGGGVGIEVGRGISGSIRYGPSNIQYIVVLSTVSGEGALLRERE